MLELDDPRGYTGGHYPHPHPRPHSRDGSARRDRRGHTPTRPLSFIQPGGGGGGGRGGDGDSRRHGGVHVYTRGGGAGGQFRPARASPVPIDVTVSYGPEDFGYSSLGARLSQDSALSASTLSLSQGSSYHGDDLSQDSTSQKPKKHKKAKKKKPKKPKVDQDGDPNMLSVPASGVTSSDMSSKLSTHSSRSAAGTERFYVAGTNNNSKELNNNHPTAGQSPSGRSHHHHRSASRTHGKSRHKTAGDGEDRDRDFKEKGKQHYRPPSRRPEPEGGNSNIHLFSASEFERLINGNEPLFSDVDISGEDEEVAHPPPVRPHRQSRLRAAQAAAAAAAGTAGMDPALAGIFIPCTQLGLNSNTMIKYAIIGTELQNISKMSNRVSILDIPSSSCVKHDLYPRHLFQCISMNTFFLSIKSSI